MSLTSARLTLRVPEEHDIDWMTAELQDPEIQRNTTVPSPYARRDAEQFVASTRERGDNPRFVVTITATGGPAGVISLHQRPKHAPSIGYWIGKSVRGQGIATEAVIRICRWGFEDLDLPIITWMARVGNDASRAVALKAGFQMEGILRLRVTSQGRLRDCWAGSLLPEEFTPNAR
ncbi:GNAT family N-acetyltransferase [Streptomyces lavendulae]|uniref:GNAT family N-acetyltransferase n=1 Tax=Streptomyces lavendulae TaxID=1914 RepID=UPI0024A25E50|nr:GNAT family N-acetyltransferase [Streptomyces lavendulae]GLW03764.1 acetyltransferase [Streptomyces lavendulae subsp. lavendulae]